MCWYAWCTGMHGVLVCMVYWYAGWKRKVYTCRTVRLMSAPSPSHTPLPWPGVPNSQKMRKVSPPPSTAAAGPHVHTPSSATNVVRKYIVFELLKWLAALSECMCSAKKRSVPGTTYLSWRYANVDLIKYWAAKESCFLSSVMWINACKVK